VPAAVVVSDAHLGPANPPEAFLRFLARVPDLGGHLVVNGDLFDFWLSTGPSSPPGFRSSAPRRPGPGRHQLTVTGGTMTAVVGSGGPAGRSVSPRGGQLELAGWRCAVLHGDGMNETHLAARVMHTVTRWPATVAAFRWLHPDLGSPGGCPVRGLARQTRQGAILERPPPRRLPGHGGSWSGKPR
jgi:hypothetical protein